LNRCYLLTLQDQVLRKMEKIKSSSQLEHYRESIVHKRDVEKKVIRLCNTGCRGRGSSKVAEALENQVREANLDDKVTIKKTGCHGFCQIGSVMVIEPDNILYQKVKPKDVPEILSETIVKGEVLDRLLYRDLKSGEKIRREADIPFYQHQSKTVSHYTGKIDPTDIEDYLAPGGYGALAKALTSMKPMGIIETVEASGLRGRGGGGFPAGRKWRSCREAPGIIKYVIANGDEGDPGAFMDRSLMEGDPHSIIEGMIIGAYAIGAHEGFIYVRDEYPIAVEHLSKAIKQAESLGLLGEDILGTGFDFTIRIITGAGAFVCGESTALMNSLEGRVGEPRAKYVHTVESGLWDRPSTLNNVETLANVPLIINRGAQWYADTGTDTSKGTKIFSLVGKVRNTGLVEVPMGINLSESVFDIGGGIKRDKEFKAVQTGGPSGGCIPMNKIDMPVDYDSLKQLGAIMGSGGMIVMDENNCMVDTAKCALGGTAPNQVLSTISYFRDEYEAHIFDKKCRAGVCRNLFDYYIDEKLCNGCTLCRVKCPEEAISGEKKKPHVIDEEKCIRCGICFSLCKKEAVLVK